MQVRQDLFTWSLDPFFLHSDSFSLYLSINSSDIGFCDVAALGLPKAAPLKVKGNMLKPADKDEKKDDDKEEEKEEDDDKKEEENEEEKKEDWTWRWLCSNYIILCILDS